MITGVTGFLGSALARHLVSQGHTVLGTSRRAPVQVKHVTPEVKIEPLTLGGRISPGFFDDIECVIHCAHDFSQDGLNRNVRGTKELFERAKAKGFNELEPPDRLKNMVQAAQLKVLLNLNPNGPR